MARKRMAAAVSQGAALPEGDVARLYIRVSRFKPKEGDQWSDKMQLERGEAYIQGKGMTFDRGNSLTHADLDESAFNREWMDRPGIREHYQAALRGEFRHLVFYKVSRLGRDLRESLKMIHAFEKAGVALHFICEQIDTSTPSGRLMRNIMLSVAEMESEERRQFCYDTALNRARSGKPLGRAPFWIERDR